MSPGSDPDRIAPNTLRSGAAGAQRRKKLATKQANRARHDELVKIKQDLEQKGLVERGLNPVEALQAIIDDSMVRYLHEQMLNEQRRRRGLKVSDAKERALAREAAYYSTLALQYNIADRQTRVQEKRTGLLATLLQRVLQHPDINLPQSKIRRIPRLLEESALELQSDIGKQAEWDDAT